MDVRTAGDGNQVAAPPAEMEHRHRVDLDVQRQDLERELTRRAFRIVELEESVRRTEAEYRDSLSWRLTAPLRALRAHLGSAR